MVNAGCLQTPMHFNPYVGAELTLAVPIRGEGRRKTSFEFPRDAELFLLISSILIAWQKGQPGVDLNPQQLQALLNTGLFSQTPDHIPRPVFFECLLDCNTPPPLLPMALPESNADQPWIFNAHLVWQFDATLPTLLNEQVPGREYFSERYPILWVATPETGTWSPYWFTPTAREWVFKLFHNQVKPHALPPVLFNCLVLADILVLPTQLSSRKQAWATTQEQARADYVQHQYALLLQIVNPLQVAALRDYFRAIEREGFYNVGDKQCPGRLTAYKDAVLFFFQHQLRPLLADIVESPLQETFSYLSIYLPQSELLRHRDRPQCRWNFSLMLDENPTFQGDEKWPLFIEVDHHVHEVNLKMGDLVLYQGAKHEHWREKLAPNHKVGVCTGHYVSPGFTAYMG